MKRKISRSLRAYSTFIIFIILSSSLIATAALAIFLYSMGKLHFIFGNPILAILWLYVVSVIVSTVITAFIGKWVLSPVIRISDASKQVAKGNFNVKLDEESRIDEIQTTSKNFNNMIKGLSTIETLRNDFIANVSHEFKTPITAIEGYAMLLQDPEITESEKNEYVEKILFNTGRLSTLAGNILMLSKIENQTIPCDRQRFRLDEQIRQSLVLFEPKWSKKNLDLVIDLDDATITNCESFLMQVWQNIIGNAIKYSEYGGKIHISLKVQDAFAIVSIRDEGPGMDEKTMNHIFEKFYQGDTSRKSDGNGLGLSLVKRILDLCGGEISVKSSVGAGSDFIVRLPL